MLALHEVYKSFGEVRALDGVSLEVPDGTTTALIGLSGCGKSTILRMFVGLETPDEGTVVLQDLEIDSATVGEARRRLGYVIQDGGLFPHMTSRANIVLAAQHFGWTRGRVDARLEELVELTAFPPDGLDRYPLQLSGGQRQRVAFMRGLMLDPDVLLLDEPFAALDPMIRYDLQQDLLQIFRRLGKTVLLVTHDLAEAAYLGDELVLMDQGHIAQQGGLTDLLEKPASDFVRSFVGAQASPQERLRERNA